MKKLIDGIIVVEGKTDVAFLSEFIEAEFVITNGSEIPATTIDYLKTISEKKNIYVLTDPDSPGKRIRDVLDKNIANLHHCFVNKENCIKKNKVGVAESNKEEILKALQNARVFNKTASPILTMTDLFQIGLVGTKEAGFARENVSQKLHIGYCNAKTFLKRLNSLNITKEELTKIYGN